MYDLILKGGTVVDPSSNRNGLFDVAIEDGNISHIAPDITGESRRVINVEGKIVTPGLIDMHTHVFAGVNQGEMHPDDVGVYAGVTTLADAGTGSSTIRIFPKYVTPQCHTEIFAFMHICQAGTLNLRELIGPDVINVANAVRAIEDCRDLVCGIKTRMVAPLLEAYGMDALRLAKRAAREGGVKLMVHIGDTEKRWPAEVVREMLPLLDEGDIITHLFTPNPGGVLDANLKVVPEAIEARDRGIILDSAHGRMNFSFEVGQRVVEQGLLPDCISTDISAVGRVFPVHSMVEMMTRFLALGFTLEQVITMSTTNPARALGQEHRLGSLQEGRQADVSVIDVRDGDWIVHDMVGGTLPTKKAIVPVLAVKRGQSFSPEWGPHPWGWEPESAPGPRSLP